MHFIAAPLRAHHSFACGEDASLTAMDFVCKTIGRLGGSIECKEGDQL